jgi:hypothetical protein
MGSETSNSARSNASARSRCLPSSGFYHLLHRVDSEDSAHGPDQINEAIVNAGSPGPVAISRTACPLPISPSSTRSRVTGANICWTISRCFLPERSGNASSVYDVLVGCMSRSIPSRRVRRHAEGDAIQTTVSRSNGRLGNRTGPGHASGSR